MNFELESKKTLTRILTSCDMSDLSKAAQKEIVARLEAHFPRLFRCYYQVYGWQYDFHFHIEYLVKQLIQAYTERSQALKRHDRKRAKQDDWYKSNEMVGMALYVDLHGSNLKALAKRIPYFQKLGINYLHLMPLYAAPEGDSDGGYAVSDYRKVNPTLGDVDDLKKLASQMARAGISLVLDFVFNHTSDEHEWAQKAKLGEEKYQAFYYMFDDKEVPNQYEQNLREIFPQVRRGNFTFNTQSQKWVWTTFNNFQWDLNYANPEVFNAICSEMLFLANIGCDALRLDALAFIWKEMGTDCENRPHAHTLIQAFNACLQISAPAVVFKSEAIVHPDEVVKYIDKDECQLSYNPQLMALIWNSLATRKTNLLSASLQKNGEIASDCAWVNYVRCHDDIGWTFDDGVAQSIGVNPHDHRRFLNDFYTGRFPGSFANGVAFGENPSTGDCRVCGSLASLCGLENALELNDKTLILLAEKRISLVHSIILSFAGIPLLYAGDELALLNDYRYKLDHSKEHDARWVHRIEVTDKMLNESPSPRVTNDLQEMIRIRKTNSIFGAAKTLVLNPPNHHCFAFLRQHEQDSLLCLSNFSEHELVITSDYLKQHSASIALDLLSKNTIDCHQNLVLGAYEKVWLMSAK